MLFSRVAISIVLLTTLVSARGLGQQTARTDEPSQEERQLLREEQEAREEIQRLVAQFLAAKDSHEAGETCLKLFPSPFNASFFDPSFEELLVHDNPHIAVQVAWRRYSRMVPRRGMWGGKSNNTIDPRDLERFLGFLEGRAQVLAPGWWERTLADPDDNEPSEEKATRRGWTILSEAVVSKENDFVTLDISGNLSTPIPAASFNWIIEHADNRLIGTEKNDHCAVLLEHSHIAARSKLVCIDLSQSKEAWRNVVWGTGCELGPRSGLLSLHRVSIELNDKGVFVFGAMNRGEGLYAEGFRLKDGTPIFRFATKNWMIKELPE